LFVRVNADSALRSELLDKLQVRASDAKGVFIVSKNATLKHNAEFMDKDDVLEFLNLWSNGEASRYYKSSTNVQEQSGPV
jgi:hypothetical protein